MSEPSPPPAGARRARLRDSGPGLAVVALICAGHAALTWLAMGGHAGLTSPWPLLQADHGIHYGHGLVIRDLVRGTGFTGGYDPTFMAGFPMSVMSGTSFTPANATLAICRGADPAVVYKLTVFAAIALAPVLMAGAGFLFGASARGVAWSTALYFVYFWSDFPRSHAYLGMVAYLSAIPVGLVAAGLLANYLERGGWWRWGLTALALTGTFCAHLTTPMVVGPAGLVAYGVAWARARRGSGRFPRGRHVGFWAFAPVILVLNAPWWLPGFWLWGTVGETAFAFFHPESVVGRVAAIFWNEPTIESILIGLGVGGVALLAGVRPVAAGGLGGVIAAGFGWGYLAGFSRALDGLQPGRHTYACYSGLCLAAGFGVDRAMGWLRAARAGRPDRWASVAIVLVGVRVLGPATAGPIAGSVFAPVPFLSSQPQPSLLWLVDQVKAHVKPGERLLYEETGLAIPGLADPFGDRHDSPVLPALTGVEVLGGPYLHSPLKTNFTQFGEGKLFGRANWGRDHFERYARLYRPAAIACWTPHARAFCRAHPDLIRVVAESETFTLGRVVGFEGATIRGRATVRAGPNRLEVAEMAPDPAGLVVLRYHWAPGLVAEPAVPIEPVFLEDDPVAFIGLRPAGPGPVVFRLALPPRAGWWSRLPRASR